MLQQTLFLISLVTPLNGQILISIDFDPIQHRTASSLIQEETNYDPAILRSFASNITNLNTDKYAALDVIMDSIAYDTVLQVMVRHFF